MFAEFKKERMTILETQLHSVHIPDEDLRGSLLPASPHFSNLSSRVIRPNAPRAGPCDPTTPHAARSAPSRREAAAGLGA